MTVPVFLMSLSAASVQATETSEALTAPAPQIGLTVPLRENRFFLGEIDISIGMDGTGLRVNAQQLTTLFAGRAVDSALSVLSSLADAEGLVTIEQAAEAGIVLSFDASRVEVDASRDASVRPATRLSLLESRRQAPHSTEAREPKGVSAYVTIQGFSSAADNAQGEYAFSDPSLSLDGAVHLAPLGHVTLESSASVDSEGDGSRGGLRAVWIDTDDEWAVRVGDVGLSSTGYMSSGAVLGLEYTNRQQFSANRNAVSTLGDRSFFLERPAVARLIVNGVQTRRFELAPGPYDVSDFPLTDGANDVVFIIEDDTGEVERIAFNVFADLSLLRPGQFEYGVSLGVLSDNGRFSYDGATVASGFFERGLTFNLSGALGAQVSSDQAGLIAGHLNFSQRFGYISARAAASAAEDQPDGGAAGISWRPSRNAALESGQSRRSALALAAEYQSRHFGGLFTDDANNTTAWRLNASYGQTLAESWPVSIGLGFNLNRDGADTGSITLSTGKSFANWSISAQARYQDAITTSGGSTDEDEWDASLRLNYRLSPRASASAFFTVPDNSAGFQYSQSSQRNGVGAWNYSVGVGVNENEDVQLTGGGLYSGNRFVASASQSADVRTLTSDQRNVRGSFRLGTAVAYADGQLALGRPINSSFLILYPHASLGDRPVVATSGGRANQGFIARSGVLGPALIANTGNSGTSGVAYDVENLPLGYDLGSGVANVAMRYRSGQAQEIGSARSVTVIGKLLNESGEPLPVTPGIATPVNNADNVRVDLFSNRRGRFGAQGLSPGQWTITMQTRNPLTYRLDIPESTVGLFRAGELKPVGDSP